VASSTLGPDGGTDAGLALDCPSFHGGTVVTLATGTDAGGLFSSPGGVYWQTIATPDGGAVVVSGATGATVTLPPLTSGLTADSTSVYAAGWQEVIRLPLDGGAPMTLSTGDTIVSALAVDAANAYWASAGTSLDGPGWTDGVFSEPLTGGPVTALGSPDVSFALEPFAIAVDDTYVYCLDVEGETGPVSVERIPKAGGPALVLVPMTSAVSPLELVLDANRVYLLGTDGAVFAVPKAGGPLTTIADGPGGTFAIDGCNVYRAVGGFGNTLLVQIPLAGGDASTLAVSENSSTGPIDGIAVDATSIYWITQGPIWDPSHNPADPAGAILKLSPK
jgi:hypothetical protein